MNLKLYTLPLLFSLPFSATAQDSVPRISQLNEVSVTATKGPQKASETGKVVTILTHEYLEKNSGKTIAAILSQQAGITINGAQNNRGTVPEVYMRGASNGNALILIDGLPVSDASQIANSFDLNFISPDLVERIEILRGSQSTLYGSNAVAGVINIITRKKTDKKFGVTANTSYGSYNSFLGNVSAYGNAGKFSYLLGYKYETSNGLSDAYDSTGKAGFDKDGFQQHSVFAKLGLQATSRWRLQYLFDYSNYRHDLDEGAFIDDRDYTGKANNMLHGFSSEYQFKNGSWHVLYSYQRTKRHILNDSGYVAPTGFSKYDLSDFTSNIHQVESYVNWNASRVIRLVAGGAFSSANMDQFNQRLGQPAPWDPNPQMEFTRLSYDSAHARQTSVYASLLLHNLGGFNLEAGGRFNHHNIYGNNQTFTFNPSYLIHQNHKVFINISSAYKIPSLYQLYTSIYGNKDLKPESTVSYEGGYQATVAHQALDFRVTGFGRRTSDLILFTSNYVNADKQWAYGAEVEADWHITRQLDLNVNYAYTDGRLHTTQNGKDTSWYNLYRIPKHAVNATLGYQVTRALYASASYRYTGERYQGAKPMGDYYTLDLYGEYKFGNLLKIYAGFRNITDNQYFDILGYNSRRFNCNAGVVLNL
ncbi:TonB-dependent receptor plug domain-containing protein [Chitinophaga varians]|uniref:TonB-dependent receptor plug domain-containing protein n=1 Tax=Chitinophaga varians TaxID=2202339 RepID=UPI00165F9738|nr:TonB-dependent receptor [Chitinophaga varians]MBC9910553.1 TonB-dependent receptor [Chitinophaga varians]